MIVNYCTLLFAYVFTTGGVNWTGHNFRLELRDTGYAASADKTVPNGLKDFNRPCDMLEKNAHLCSVLNAPLPNSAIHVPPNRLPLSNCHPCSPTNTAECRLIGINRMPQIAQQQCWIFNKGAQTYCGVYANARLPGTLPGNRPAVACYSDNNVALHGSRPPANGMLVSYAETRNGYCTKLAGRSMMAGQTLACRPMQWVAPPVATSVQSEFVCKMNGVTAAAVTCAPGTMPSASSLQFSALVSTS